MNKAETREVDCVITSGTVTTVCVLLFVCMNVQCLLYLLLSHAGEVQKMLEEKNVSLSDIEPAPLDAM